MELKLGTIVQINSNKAFHNFASPLMGFDIVFMKAKLRSSSWWIRFFVQIGLEENETAGKKFEQASIKKSYKPACQVFHLKSYP